MCNGPRWQPANPLIRPLWEREHLARPEAGWQPATDHPVTAEGAPPVLGGEGQGGEISPSVRAECSPGGAKSKYFSLASIMVRQVSISYGGKRLFRPDASGVPGWRIDEFQSPTEVSGYFDLDLGEVLVHGAVFQSPTEVSGYFDGALKIVLCSQSQFQSPTEVSGYFDREGCALGYRVERAVSISYGGKRLFRHPSNQENVLLPG